MSELPRERIERAFAGLSAEEIEERVLATQLKAMRACTTELGRLRKLRDELERMCKHGEEDLSEDGYPLDYVLTDDLRRILAAARDPEPES